MSHPSNTFGSSREMQVVTSMHLLLSLLLGVYSHVFVMLFRKKKIESTPKYVREKNKKHMNPLYWYVDRKSTSRKNFIVTKITPLHINTSVIYKNISYEFLVFSC